MNLAHPTNKDVFNLKTRTKYPELEEKNDILETEMDIQEELSSFEKSSDEELQWAAQEKEEFEKIISDQKIKSSKMKNALKVFYYRFFTARIVNAVCPFYTNVRISREEIYNRAIASGLNAKIHPCSVSN